MPTLAELADVDANSTNPLDGISIAPLLLESTDEWQDRTLIQHWKGKISVRTQQYRLDHEGRLYDIPKDPGQTNPINNESPQVLAQLKQLADEFRVTMLQNYGKEHDNRPFVIGHPDATCTQVPARDGIAHGNIERSNRWPNDSFFRNWTSVDDSITWNCEVGQSGTYRVDLLYTCPAAEVGSSIKLAFGDQQLNAKIVEAHDPPLIGMESDRFQRMESYVKEFNRVTLGEIQLTKGKGILELRATEIPGSQVMDFRMLLLTRLEP